jgi:hypothetical protein
MESDESIRIQNRGQVGAHGEEGTSCQSMESEESTRIRNRGQIGAKGEREPPASPRNAARSSPKVKAEVKPESDAAAGPEPRLITGVYNISSRQLEEQYPHEASNLRFFLCVDNETRKIWGGFELASKSGVPCIKDDFTSTSGPLSFG